MVLDSASSTSITPSGRPTQRGPLQRWGMFCTGLAAIWVIIFWLAPLAERIPCVAELHSFIHERNIDATALVYTDIEEFGDADVEIRNAINH